MVVVGGRAGRCRCQWAGVVNVVVLGDAEVGDGVARLGSEVEAEAGTTEQLSIYMGQETTATWECQCGNLYES